LVTTANLTIGPPRGPAVSGFMTSARAAGIPHDMLSALDVRKRWPQLNPPDDFVAGLESEAGIVFPERCIHLFLRLARASGAVLQVNEPVSGWTSHGDGIAVQTSRGRYTAGRLLIATGARGGRLVGPTGSLLVPKRVPVHWIEPPTVDTYRLGQFPVNFWQVPAGETDAAAGRYREFYTLPTIEAGGRVKAAFHNGLEDGNPEQTAAPVTARETAAIRSMLEGFVPSLAYRPMDADTCMYTLTPDEHFVLGPVPENQNVFTVALAGHGFKFAPVLGEVLADLIQGVQPTVDVGCFLPSRFTGQA
jgi:sarcosine oxidase